MRFLLLLLACLVPFAGFADVQLPSLISDNMVLQQKSANLWGNADPGEKVSVKIGSKKLETTADANGKWSLKVPASSLSPGESYEMTITGKNVLTIRNVLVGEVWVCSGQSNMEWSVMNSQNSAEEIASAKYPTIRLFTVGRNATDEPQTDCVGRWVICTPESVAPFSAVGYFFARELNSKLKTPVGMIHSSWGGTPAQAWTPRSTLEGDPALKPILDSWNKAAENYQVARAAFDKEYADWKKSSDEAIAAGRPAGMAPKPPLGAADSQKRPSCLYNGMIAPLLPYTIKGAIWYQGESNASEPIVYRDLFPALIKSWREAWGTPNLPFHFVQLANFKKKTPEPADSNWAMLREAQAMALKLPHTGMAVAIDLGDEKSIHPKNKQDVGKRLAAIALSKTYSMERIIASGPVFAALRIDSGKAVVSFKDSESGLSSRTPELRGFAIAGEDKVFHRAEAKIQGQEVVVSSPQVPSPVAVRYAWADNPDADLQNKAGLPAAPFRTDNW